MSVREVTRPTLAPFEQLPYERLPERPRMAHPFYDAETDDVVVDSQPFGRLTTRVTSYGPPGAPPLLLVHGLMTAGYSWRYVLSGSLGERHRLVIPDLPGCGRSAPLGDHRPTAPALATFIGELQAVLGIEGCAAVGNSLGGYICLHRALTQPASFERLAVIHAPVIADARLVGLHLALRVPGVGAALRHVVRKDPYRWAHRNVHYYDETLKSREEAREYGEPLAGAAGARSFTSWLRDALDPRDLRAVARELERRRDAGTPFPVPLQLTYAREDPTVSPDNGERLRELLPDAEFHWLQRSSHFAQVDSPDRLVALLDGFLGR
jgi:pimeloyl-ACP methyl ester carboxylesterase